MLTKHQYKLSHGSNHIFEDVKQSNVMEAYLHNNNERCTLLYKGYGAYTIELKDACSLKKAAKYNLQIGNQKHIDCQIQFKIKTETMYFEPTLTEEAEEILEKENEEDVMFRIRGTGVDRGEIFTIESSEHRCN